MRDRPLLHSFGVFVRYMRTEGVTTTAAVLVPRRRVIVAAGLDGHPSPLSPVFPLAGVRRYPLAVSPRTPCLVHSPHVCFPMHALPRSSASVRALLLLLLLHAGQTGLSGPAYAGAVFILLSVPRGVWEAPCLPRPPSPDARDGRRLLLRRAGVAYRHSTPEAVCGGPLACFPT